MNKHLDTIVCSLCGILLPMKYSAATSNFDDWKIKTEMLKQLLVAFANEIKRSAIEP